MGKQKISKNSEIIKKITKLMFKKQNGFFYFLLECALHS